jgi:sugar transferase (PEP-CTERM system associated)
MLFLSPQDALLELQYQYGFAKVGLVTAMSLMFSYYFDLYEPQIVSGKDAVYFRILLVLGFDCFTVAALMFFFPGFALYSGGVYATGVLILTPALLIWRNVYDWIISLPFLRERVYVLGAGDYARSIIALIRSRPDFGMDVVGWRELTETEPEERKHFWIEELNNIGDGTASVNRVIIAMETQRGELPAKELLMLRFKGIAIEDVGALRERLSGKIQLDGLRPTNFLFSEGFRVLPSQQLPRRLVSTLAAAIGLLLFAPFFPIVVLLVRISSEGPIFFKQTRVGMNGRNFSIFKFRSMFTNAEAAGARWATKNDPRVTKIGMFMRKTRIDEVPQLWNVLRGDMGFVGPRPERPEFIPMLEEALPFYYLRQLIRPGLTGWAQVRYGYGATMAETKEKLEYDLYYIKHMSIGLDLLIMFETIKTILRRRGAQ